MEKFIYSLLVFSYIGYSQTIPEVPINQFTEAGYLNSKYYPIGWSEDERYFALMILSESNYASLPEGHGFDFLVKDVITDKDAYIKSYSGYDICEGKFDAYGQGECDFSAKGIFKLHKATFTEALNKYNINTKTPLAYSTFPIKNAKGESITIQYDKAEKDGYISKETLTATNNQQGSKTILQSTYDSNFRRLASEIVGAFVSPSKERSLVIQKYTSSGIEGDRDIELNFIGCHTQKGYQFNGLVLTEKTFGNLNLDQSTPLSITDLTKAFKTQKITKNLGEGDGPSFWYYNIGKLATASTVDTEANTLHQLWIKDTSIPDQYGVTINMTFEGLIEKRPNLNISSEHFHIYLYEKGSNIVYEMSLGDDYDGPDLWEYDFEHLKKYNSKITGMGWVIKNN